MIITIDGPAGSGKSTHARKLARALGFEFLNTGAMYRAITWALLQNGVSFDNTDEIQKVLQQSVIRFENDQIFLNDANLSSKIRTPEIDRNVSAVSGLKIVRDNLSLLQRKIGNSGNYVVEGRDMGSVVFPNADYKFYMDASVEDRAQRRQAELKEKGIADLDLESIRKDIEYRDQLDKTREHSPLQVPSGAIIINTSGLSIDAVGSLLLSYVKLKS